MSINIAPADKNLSVSLALPGANASNTTAVLDLQAVAPNSNAWQLGRIAVVVPAIPENTTGAGITFALQAAPPSLTSGIKAPALYPPGAFVTPVCAQTITIPSVAIGGSLAQLCYFNLATDANGSTYQFYQFVQTTPAGVNTQQELITYQFIGEMGD